MVGNDDDPYDDQAGPDAGEEAGHLQGDEALHSEGQDELHAPEAGHQVRRHQLQRLGQGGEGQQPGQRQAWRIQLETWKGDNRQCPTDLRRLPTAAMTWR